MNARNDQPTTKNEEKFERTILSNPMAGDHQKSYKGNHFTTKRNSLHSAWKTKKKRRSVDDPCSSFLALVQSLLHMIIALAIMIAGSPLFVAGSESTKRLTLKAGQPGVIPFDIPCSPDNISQVLPLFTIRFKSKLRPFCIDGEGDIKGFKSPSQLTRFTTSIAEMTSSICVKVNIDPVDIVDEDMYILRTFFPSSEILIQETVMKEIVVQSPPGPAKCFITLSENNSNPYELHCQATSGSVETTLTCYQHDQRVEVKGDITDNGQVTRAVFLLLDITPFSCCSHDVNFNVNGKMCHDFEWPPSKNSISSPTAYTPTTVSWNTEQASNTFAESQVDSGTCKQYMASLVPFTIGLMIYLFLC